VEGRTKAAENRARNSKKLKEQVHLVDTDTGFSDAQSRHYAFVAANINKTVQQLYSPSQL
jgi:hypothetical protein